MRWFFSLISPFLIRKKVSRGFFCIWPIIYHGRARSHSFGVLRDVFFYSAPRPTTSLTFIAHLLLMHLFLFCAFGAYYGENEEINCAFSYCYCAIFIYSPSPNTPIFILRIWATFPRLLLRHLLLRAFSYATYFILCLSLRRLF